MVLILLRCALHALPLSYAPGLPVCKAFCLRLSAFRRKGKEEESARRGSRTFERAVCFALCVTAAAAGEEPSQSGEPLRRKPVSHKAATIRELPYVGNSGLPSPLTLQTPRT